MSRRNDIDVVDRDLLAALDLPNRHRGVAFDQLRHQRFMVGIEMLDDDECHARRTAKAAHHLAQSFQPAGRSTHSDHGKIRSICVL